ncbi:MAG: T9SS type A sorting domain-containing protein [Bacteroidota bacterium]
MKNKLSILMQNFYRFLLLMIVLSVAQKSSAQTASSYSFSTSSGTYTAITGGTLLSSGATMDDASFSVTIPSFTYLGVAYTQVYVSENGYIQFGSTATTTTMRTYLSSTEAAAKTGVAGYSRDIGGKSATSNLRTQTIGSEVIFQWTNMANFASTAHTITFQIRLNTSTNVISVVYNMSATGSTTAQVGLRGSTTDFNNRTSTSNWAASTAGAVNTATMTLSSTVFPASGLNYIWSPPLPCSGKPAGGTLSSSAGASPICPSATATLSVTGSTIATGIAYAWDQSLVSATGPWTPIGGATAATYLASPSACTNMYYRRRTICTLGGLFDSSNAVLVSVKCALTPPYFEDFESITATNTMPNCMTATNLGSLVTTYLAGSTYNRSNHTPGGAKYAAFRWGSNDYMFTPAINITAGKTYEFSFWYIADGYTGWDSLKVLYGSSPSAAGMTTSIGATLSGISNTVYKKYRVRFIAATSGVQYFGIYCKASGVPWYLSIDDIGLQEAPLCAGIPSPGAPEASSKRVCGTGSVELDLPYLPLAVGYKYEWQDSVAGSTWGSDPGRPSFGGTTAPFATGSFSNTTYFRCIVTCNTTGESAISSVLKIDAGPFNPPYFEDFESISSNNQLPTCMTATNLGSLVLTYTATPPPTVRNRFNHTPGGSKFASFRWSCDDYIFSPQMNLIGGQKYVLSFWYITDGLSGWNTLSAKIGLDATPAAMTTTLRTITAPINSGYLQYSDTFTAPTSGTYYFGIYCNSGSAPWYLSIDDIGLQFKACDGMPTATTISGTVASGIGVCPNNIVTLVGSGGSLPLIPGIKYQWQRRVTPVGLWKNIPGAIDTMISSDTLGGYDYRLATICTNTGDTAFSTLYSLPLLPAHPPVSITPATSPIAFCLGDTVKFNATSVPGSVYDWMVDSVVIPGWKFSDLSATTSGVYHVRVSSSATPCPAYSNKVVLVRNDPDYSIVMSTPTDSIVCEGTSLLLSGFGSKTGLSYQWSKDNVLIPGAVSNNYLVNTSGYYRISAYDGLSVCSAMSRSIKITVNPNPPAILSVMGGGGATACENEGVLLKASVGAFSYEWTKGGSTVFGWSDSMQLIKNSGLYRVKVRNAEGCVSLSLPINVTILPSPIPVIVRGGFTLSTSTPYFGYIWVRNGVDTVSKTSTVSLSKNGVYKVYVQDANGCPGESGPFDVNDAALGINQSIAGEMLRIYPNPTNDKVFVESPIKIRVAVKDATGRMVIAQQQVSEIDMSKLADGIYILEVSDDNNMLISQQKITKISQR